MGFFKSISDACEDLSQVAQGYLDTLPFIASEEVVQRVWNWACNQMDKDERDHFIFNGKNGLAEDIVDTGVPFSMQPTNGSLHYSLGWSIVAQEANLRSLLEYVEGRQQEWIKFKCLADMPE